MKSPDFSRVAYPSIEKLFRNAGMESPAELRPVCYNGNKREYLKQELKFSFDAPLEKVWNSYKNAHPAISWQTNMIRFGFMYTRADDSYLYHKDEGFSGISKGQIYLVNLNLVNTKLQIAVAHEVDLVDNEEKVIKLCYLNTGKTAGSQWLKFIEAGPSKTIIEHNTLYQGNSFFRDRLLYPTFHKKAMKQFHQKMNELMSRAQ